MSWSWGKATYLQKGLGSKASYMRSHVAVGVTITNERVSHRFARPLLSCARTITTKVHRSQPHRRRTIRRIVERILDVNHNGFATFCFDPIASDRHPWATEYCKSQWFCYIFALIQWHLTDTRGQQNTVNHNGFATFLL